jgi:hypothetical protein
MQTLLPDDLYWVRRRLASPVVKLMKHYAGKAVIAGGFIRSCVANELINDIDIFAPSTDAARAWAHYLVEAFNKMFRERKLPNVAKLLETQNAFTIVGVNTTVQIIHRWTYEKPEDIVGSFDFTIARAAMWWSPEPTERIGPKKRFSRGHKWRTMIDDRFYADLAARRLVYCSPIRNEDAGGSFLRAFKFYQRGYRMPLDSMGAVIARLAMGVDWKSGFLAGRTGADYEKVISKTFAGLLREVDPAVDPDHVMHLPTAEEQDADDEEGDELPVEASTEPTTPVGPPRYPFWVTFEHRGPACVFASNKDAALAIAGEITKATALDAKVLPYAATPVLNGNDHGAFCWKPGECAGRSSCPRNPSCSD